VEPQSNSGDFFPFQVPGSAFNMNPEPWIH